MIRKVFISLALILISSSTFSQFRGGLKFGGVSSSFQGSGVQNFSTEQKASIHGGGVIHFDLLPRFSLQAELLYSRKGAPVQFVSENAVYKGDVSLYPKLNYFSIPLLFQFNLGTNPSGRFHLDFGAYNSWLIKGSYTGTREYQDENGDKKVVDFSMPSTFSGQDAGLTFGIGLMSGRIMFDFRYDLGLKDVFTTSDGIPGLRNRSLMISVGYFLND